MLARGLKFIDDGGDRSPADIINPKGDVGRTLKGVRDEGRRPEAVLRERTYGNSLTYACKKQLLLPQACTVLRRCVQFPH